MDKKLIERSGSACELCKSTSDLHEYLVDNPQGNSIDNSLVVCTSCHEQIQHPDKMDTNHWRCLNDSMWSEFPVVQVMTWRLLNRIKSEGWPQDLLDMMYLDDDTLAWAKSSGDGEDPDDAIVHKDSNGAVLQNGDTVVLIKELDVKGATFSAKRGTAVRNIRLVHDNPEQIEGKIEGQSIVILTKFVKK